MLNKYRTLIAGLALLACNTVLRADQFGLLVPASQDGQPAGAMPQGNMNSGPPPVLGQQPPLPQPQLPQPQYDWLGRQISYETAMAGPEMQIGQAGQYACDDCCLPPWAHRSGVFFEMLFLRARNAEVAYAVPVDGAIIPPAGVAPIQVGSVAVADPDYAAGWRIGATYAMDPCSSVTFSWARFQSSTNDSTSIGAPFVLRSTVLHPGTANAGSDFLDARAVSDVDFDLVDLDYQAVWDSSDLYVINYLIGLRYAHLNQDFTGLFTSTGTLDQLRTNSNFDGAGIRLGLNATRYCCNSGMFVYGRTNASFIAGSARARYTQSSDVDPLIVNTGWRAGRVVTILDLELGAGWQSRCGRWKINAGYLFMGWFNAVPTNQWINSVQQNNFVGLGDTMTFDGFTARVTYQW
jgi:Legionella pneumophila major outer membrane protein precursor